MRPTERAQSQQGRPSPSTDAPRNATSHRPARPHSITAIGWLFVGAGIVGLAYHATELDPHDPFEYGLILVLFVRLLAIVAGVFMLRGADWARWLALLWITYHAILSAFHSVSETVTHVVLLAGLAYLLLRSDASLYFRGTSRGIRLDHVKLP